MAADNAMNMQSQKKTKAPRTFCQLPNLAEHGLILAGRRSNSPLPTQTNVGSGFTAMSFETCRPPIPHTDSEPCRGWHEPSGKWSNKVGERRRHEPERIGDNIGTVKDVQSRLWEESVDLGHISVRFQI